MVKVKQKKISGYTNEEVVKIIDRIVKRLAGRFKFGYHQIQDMEQQARLIAWTGIDNYDGIRPLENYLWVHVRNRLFNFKRDNFCRPGSPCTDCFLHNSSSQKCNKYEDKQECVLYARQQHKNTTKLNLTYPIELSCVDDYNEDNMYSCQSTEKTVLNNELRTILNRYIPVEWRHSYLRLLYNCTISSQHKYQLYKLVREIINKYYYFNDE